MSSVPVTTDRLYHDLKNERLRARKQLTKIERHVDFQNIVGSVFAGQDYNYKLQPNGNFMIIAEAGMSICGKWNGVGWNIYLTVGFGSKIVTDYDVEIEISAAAFADYVPLFNSMIAKLHKLYAAYYESSKANKSSKLLEMMVRETLSQLNISKILIEPTKDKKSLLRLGRPITGNLLLYTTIDFDNYEERCHEFKQALEQIPSQANDNILTSIYYKEKGERWSLSGLEKVQYPVLKPGEEIKMHYNYSALKPNNEYEGDIPDVLTRLGYRFTVSPEGTLQILINRMYLYRHELDTWFSDSNDYRSSIHVNIPDDEFKQLIKYIALASYKRGYFPAPYWDVNSRGGTLFYDCVKPILEACLPNEYYTPAERSFYTHNPWIKLGYDESMKNGFKWNYNDPNWLSILFYVIHNYEFIKNLPQSLERPEYPNVKTIIRQN